MRSKTLTLLQIFGVGSGQKMRYKIIAANLAMHQLYSVCTIPSVYTSLISSSLHFTFISWMSYSVPGKRMNAEFVKFTNSILNFLKTAGSIDWRRLISMFQSGISSILLKQISSTGFNCPSSCSAGSMR